MAKSIKQLRSDLTVLDTEMKLLATELFELYKVYVDRLNEVVGKQLVLACYQVCTQKYPESFLALSYQQKTDLQTNIKNLGQKFLGNLSNYLAEIDLPNQELFVDFPVSLTGVEPVLESNEDEIEKLIEENIEHLSTINLSNDKPFYDGLNPADIIGFYKEIDDSIEETIKEFSIIANNYLRENNILPTQVPAKILEMALEAKDHASGVSNGANLLSLVIEKEDISSHGIKDITPIVAVCLRLEEIEFNDSPLSGDRRRIMSMMTKLIDVQKRYDRLTRLYAIASAESSWRSCWSEDN